jgi:hypothetical protein
MAFVLLAAAVIVRLAITLARPQWTWFPLSAQLAQTVVTLIILKFMIDAGGHPTSGGWYPFVMLADSVRNSSHYMKIAAVVNASVLISLVCAWIGVCIGGGVQTWQLLKHIRKQISASEQTAPLQIL